MWALYLDLACLTNDGYLSQGLLIYKLASGLIGDQTGE